MWPILEALLRVSNDKPEIMKYRGWTKLNAGYFYAPYVPINIRILDPLNDIVSGCTRAQQGGKEVDTID